MTSKVGEVWAEELRALHKAFGNGTTKERARHAPLFQEREIHAWTL